MTIQSQVQEPMTLQKEELDLEARWQSLRVRGSSTKVLRKGLAQDSTVRNLPSTKRATQSAKPPTNLHLRLAPDQDTTTPTIQEGVVDKLPLLLARDGLKRIDPQIALAL